MFATSRVTISSEYLNCSLIDDYQCKYITPDNGTNIYCIPLLYPYSSSFDPTRYRGYWALHLTDRPHYLCSNARYSSQCTWLAWKNARYQWKTSIFKVIVGNNPLISQDRPCTTKYSWSRQFWYIGAKNCCMFWYWEIISLAIILQMAAAGVDSLDEVSGTNNKISLRYDGIVLIVFLTYSNTWSYDTNKIQYPSLFHCVDIYDRSEIYYKCCRNTKHKIQVCSTNFHQKYRYKSIME